MAETPQDPKEIFLAALEKKDPAERAALLDRSCAGDAALRRRVEDLLRAYGQSNGPLEHLAVAFAPTEIGEPVAEHVGSIIGPYRLMEQIGEGGFGLVFVAEQQRPVRRKVALKVIRPGMDTRDVVARFEAERQALAMMDHPNIARVLEAGATDGGRPYFVMELVRGVPITDYCDRNQLTPRERLELFVSVCNAVQHAHQKGIIHRDIKPSNVLVTLHDGRPVVKVIDFGVAKALHQPLTDRTIYTRFAQMIGTPLYMSPEQAEMSGLDIDTRSDVYSLGVLLYELLTGSTPFDKKRLAQAAYDELVRIIRDEEPPKPSVRLSKSTASLPSIAAQRKTEPAKLSKMFHGDLDWITMKALEKDRTRRYETANGLAADVVRYLHDEPVEACPPSTGYRLRKFARKHRAVLVTTLAFAAVLVAGVLLSSWLAISEKSARGAADRSAQLAERQAEEARQARLLADRERSKAEGARAEAVRQRMEAESQRDRANEAIAKSERRLYWSQIAAAQAEWSAGSPIVAWRHLDACRADHRGWEYAYLFSLFNRNQRTLRGHSAPVNLASFSLDRKRIVSASDDKSLKVWDAATGKNVLTLSGHPGAVRSFAFSPDGSRLVSGCDGGIIKVWDASTGRERLTVDVKGDPVLSVEFSRDGERIFSGHRKDVWAWSASDGRALPSRATGHCMADSWHVFSAGIAGYIAATRGIELFGSRSAPSDKVFGVHFDDQGLVELPFNQTSEKIEVTGTGKGVVLPKEAMRHLLTNSPLVVSPDRKLLACTGDWGLMVWDTKTGKRICDIGEAESATCFSFSPDSQRIVTGSADATINVWKVATGKKALVLRGHKSSVASVEFSPNGKQIVSASADGTVKIWDLLAERDTVPLPTFEGALGESCVIAAGGRAVAATFPGASLPILVLHNAAGRQRSDLVYPKTPGRVMNLSPVQSMAVSSNGDWLVYSNNNGKVEGTGNGGRETTLTLFDVSAGKEVREWQFEGERYDRQCLVFSPDDAFFACGNRSEIGLYELASRRRIARIEAGNDTFEPRDLAFSSDGRKIMARDSKETFAWDITSGRKIFVLRNRQRNSSVAFRPDGRLVAFGNENQDELGEITIFNAQSGSAVHTLFGHHGQVNGLAFSPDGKRLASGGEDKTVRLWDVATGEEVLILRGHSEAISNLSFDPSGRWLTSMGGREMCVWDASQESEDARTAIRRLKNRILEWNLVDSLFTKLLLKPDVIDALKTDPSLSDEMRARALELAGQLKDDPGRLNDGSWEIVVRSDAKPDEYQRGLRAAEAAIRIAPDDFNIVNTLGVAQYRTGKYAEAVATLTWSNEHFSKSKDAGGPLPADLAFLAMAHRALGRTTEAHGFLRQLTELLKQDNREDDEEAKTILEEAENRLPEWKLVDSLFTKLLLKADVIEALKTDPALSGQMRASALELAHELKEDAGQLNDGSYWIAIRSNANPAEYQRAFRAAETAIRLAPDDFNIVNTLGVAQYRIGKYAEAIATLTRSNEHFSKSKHAGGARPQNLAFLAMAHRALGRTTEAHAFLRQLTELLKQDKWKDDEEAKTLFEEASRRLAKKP